MASESPGRIPAKPPVLIEEFKEHFNSPNTNPRWYLDDDIDQKAPFKYLLLSKSHIPDDNAASQASRRDGSDQATVKALCRACPSDRIASTKVATAPER